MGSIASSRRGRRDLYHCSNMALANIRRQYDHIFPADDNRHCACAISFLFPPSFSFSSDRYCAGAKIALLRAYILEGSGRYELGVNSPLSLTFRTRVLMNNSIILNIFH